jgi:hypothetical protein
MQTLALSGLLLGALVIVFVLPGWGIVRFLDLKGPRFLYSLILSYLILVPMLFVGRVAEVGVYTLASAYVSWVLAVLILSAIVRRLLAIDNRAFRKIPAKRPDLSRWRTSCEPISAPLVGAICAAAYVWWVGPYLEIPADVWEHLARIQEELSVFEKTGKVKSSIESPAEWGHLLSEQGRYWYLTIAIIVKLFDLQLFESFRILDSGLFLIFCAGLYSFHVFVLRVFNWHSAKTAWLAIAATVLANLTLGKDVFAFSRYYVSAPTFLNYLVFLGGVSALIEILRQEHKPKTHALLFLAAIFLAYLIHRQEAAFLITYLAIGSIIAAICCSPTMNSICSIRDLHPQSKLGARYTLAFLVILTALIVVLFGGSDELRAVHPALVIQVGESAVYRINFVEQVLTTTGVLGILVLGVFWAWHLKERSPLIFVMTAVLPFVTVLNPFFVTTFLRFNDSYTIWRFQYMQLISVLAVVLMAWIIGERKIGHSLYRRFGPLAAGAILLMAAGVMSWHLSDQKLWRYLGVRVHTLVRIPPENSAIIWADLISVLNEKDFGSRKILTDPLTAYVLDGATLYASFSRKYHEDPEHSLKRERYVETSFNEHDGWLLIVNRRDGGPSRNGRVARHWDEDVMTVSRFYSSELLNWVDLARSRYQAGLLKPGHTGLELMWESERVEIYKIHMGRLPD